MTETHDHSPDQLHCSNPDCCLHDPERFRKFQEALKEGKAMGNIKVHIAIEGNDPNGIVGEWLWAKPMGDNTAVIQNVPFFTDKVGLYDVVKTREQDAGQFQREIETVILHNNNTAYFTYEYEDEKDAVATLKTIRLFLEGEDLEWSVEGMFVGMAVMAYPAWLPFKQVIAVFSQLQTEKNLKVKLVIEEEDQE